MATKKSSLVSGMGVALAVVQRLVDAVKRAGGNNEDIHLLVTPEAGDIWDRVALLLVDCAEKVHRVLNIVVDYTRHLDDMIAAGAYPLNRSDKITENNFPRLAREWGRRNVGFKLLRFDRTVKLDEVNREMEAEGGIHATVRELLAFGAANPELQRKFTIVALGSIWVTPMDNEVAVALGCDGKQRFVTLDAVRKPLGWDSSYVFLTVVSHLHSD